MSKDEHNRKESIRRYLASESISSICENMSRSRKLFYKWQHLCESGDPEWSKNNPEHLTGKVSKLVKNWKLPGKNSILYYNYPLLT